jgi:hypothetical protein
VNLNQYECRTRSPRKATKLENVIVESKEAIPTLPTYSWLWSYHISKDEWTRKTSVHTDRRRSKKERKRKRRADCNLTKTAEGHT